MNLNEPITLRQLISFVMTPDETERRNKDWMQKRLFKHLHKISCYPFERHNPTLKRITSRYKTVVEELLSKKKTKPYDMPICVHVNEFSGEIEVTLKNPKYIAPENGLLPWGGENPPEGYYNCNDDKHNEHFAFGFTSWSKIIDTSVIVETTKLQIWEILGEILWEMTFDGFSEKECNQNQKKLKKILDERVKEITDGESVELTDGEDGKFKVVAAKSFLEDLKNIRKI